MGSVARMALDTQATVLETLREHEYLPLDLMERLQREKHLSDASVKSAILDLLQQMKIEFGPDLKLRLRAKGTAAR
jgi:hypothetical protein